ncbi:diguanylate cyclase [Chlorella sorokiniana]|uniref:Diguanylate cyclase n=1 Tax=Chlorella sorokiniana TaxID=3076 RepID=A0A2P6TGB5_CHLSO|nr:diguanylate cyclase [Chlorella sorokiniana]|eukprot:PRW33150.1 diguanylate cyclase [Chlorella sorokiniana]
MATVACELHAAFAYFHWTGFYRAPAAAAPAAAQQAEPAEQQAEQAEQQRQSERQLVIGPYQGGLGCLRIPFSKGVCGAAARERRTQLVPDVHAFPGHIACASSTQSEVVVPVLTPGGQLLAVLDVDSDLPAAFTEVDAQWLEQLCTDLGSRQWQAGL